MNQPTKQTSTLAVVSLIAGCVSLIFGIFAAIPAIICGHLALGEIKKQPEKDGKGLAMAGLIIGYVVTVLSVLIIVLFLIFFLFAGVAVESHHMLAPPAAQ